MSGGSIGLALILWVIGGLIASAGLAVYLEFATALPRSGGEKTYLSFFYTKPLYLVSCAYAAYAALLGWPSGMYNHTFERLQPAALLTTCARGFSPILQVTQFTLEPCC